jgi:two-component system phosphate regulon sensor histidine kinase PhoR
MVETLIDDPGMATGQRERFLGRIEVQTLRLSALVTDLLSLSRLESPTQELERLPMDLREPVEDALNALGSSAADAGITLTRELPAEPVSIQGDREALRQAVGNLLDNAIKYTQTGGTVQLRLLLNGARARVEVQDSGIGIEPVHQQRIFERFYRVDKARSRELGGTGLGLAIVKHIALGHGGSVSLESSPGKGSTFSMEFPLSGQAETVLEC